MKILKYQEETKEFKEKMQLAKMVYFIGGIIGIIVFFLLISYSTTVSQLMIGFLGVAGIEYVALYISYKITPKLSKNEAYFKQQEELEKLKELEETCGEYHRLKKKYKGVKI